MKLSLQEKSQYLGILTFLTVEKLVRILRNEKIIRSHSHSHSHANSLLSSSDDKKKIKKRNKGAKASKEKKSDVSSTEEVSIVFA